MNAALVLAPQFRRSGLKLSRLAGKATTRPELLRLLDRMTSAYEEADLLDPPDPSDHLAPWADAHDDD